MNEISPLERFIIIGHAHLDLLLMVLATAKAPMPRTILSPLTALCPLDDGWDEHEDREGFEASPLAF